MIQFILNEKEISTPLPSGVLLLDFIRYHRHLTGTKIGCREGDCGACTVLVGECKGYQLHYRAVTSCLTAIGSVQDKHIVTVEGTNLPGVLNPIQQSMCDESATQCGFCTPGFVVSLAGFCLSDKVPSQQNAIASIDGNICRCTGYKSIERAANNITDLLQQRKDADPIEFATTNGILPAYFAGIKARLQVMAAHRTSNGKLEAGVVASHKFLGGGTDLYVQQHDTMHLETIDHLFNKPALNTIGQVENACYFGGATTVTDLMESAVMQQYFPDFRSVAKLISSTPIRNIATIAGNFINASPIGDFTIFFLALDAQLILSDGTTTRQLPLRKLYKGYKSLDKRPEEFIEKIYFQLPAANTRLSFEKVSKRTHLDIASVNTAICISTSGHIIERVALSAGGVGPVPAFLARTSAWLQGKPINNSVIEKAIEIAQTEISPISDARGSEAYKRLLLSQLFKAHFMKLSPGLALA
ncbi:MAG: FAD binding domain-containing protein [Chitinophagaceae bacterium]